MTTYATLLKELIEEIYNEQVKENNPPSLEWFMNLKVSTILAGLENANPKKRYYNKSEVYDMYGKRVIEGSIINADGYNSVLSEDENERYLHLVEYNNGRFYSDIYSDADDINTYKTIEVVGHAEDFGIEI